MGLSNIARLAGVSKATVSRVLNNSKNVSPEIAEKVNAVVKKVGYRPKPRQQNRFSKHIAVLIIGRDLFMEYSPARWRILFGVQETLSEKGISIVIWQIGADDSLPSAINSNTTDGIIVLGQTNRQDLFDQVLNIPSVWINSQGSNDKDHALARNQLVGQMAAQYLISRGHKNLAFFRVFMEHPSIEMDGDFFSFTAMRSGCSVITLEGQKNFPDDDNLQSWLYLHNTVENAMNKLAAIRPRPTGIFIPVGPVVVMSYKQLRNAGMLPGKDIDVIGCGCENAMLASLSPRPANININAETIGRKAAEQLLWRIANPADVSPVNITVIPTLNQE